MPWRSKLLSDKLEDVEMRALESKLQLLNLQRQLSAAKCEAFLRSLEDSLGGNADGSRILDDRSDDAACGDDGRPRHHRQENKERGSGVGFSLSRPSLSALSLRRTSSDTAWLMSPSYAHAESRIGGSVASRPAVSSSPFTSRFATSDSAVAGVARPEHSQADCVNVSRTTEGHSQASPRGPDAAGFDVSDDSSEAVARGSTRNSSRNYYGSSSFPRWGDASGHGVDGAGLQGPCWKDEPFWWGGEMLQEDADLSWNAQGPGTLKNVRVPPRAADQGQEGKGPRTSLEIWSDLSSSSDFCSSDSLSVRRKLAHARSERLHLPSLSSRMLEGAFEPARSRLHSFGSQGGGSAFSSDVAGESPVGSNSGAFSPKQQRRRRRSKGVSRQGSRGSYPRAPVTAGGDVDGVRDKGLDRLLLVQEPYSPTSAVAMS